MTLLCLFFAIGAGSAIAADSAANEADSPAQSLTSGDDEEDQEAATDGSEALISAPDSKVPTDLRPIGLTEERALLGVWGDSPGEDED